MANKPKIHLNVTTNEKMALIVSSKSQYKNHIKLDQLDITNEIFLGWGNTFDAWHDYNIAPHKLISTQLDSYLYLDAFIEQPDKWALVPMSIAETLCSHTNTHICKTDFIMPDRVIYLCTSPAPKQPYLSAFTDNVLTVLKP